MYLNIESVKALTFLFDELPGTAYCIDEQGRYLVGNKEFYQDFILDKNYKNLLGSRNSDLFEPDTAKMLDANNYTVFKMGVTHTFEESKINESGQKEFWLSTKKPVFNENGDIIFLIVFSCNITERKKMEVQLGLNYLNNDIEKPLASFVYQSDYYSYLDQGSRVITLKKFKDQGYESLFEFMLNYNSHDTKHELCLKEFYDLVLYNFPANIFWKNNDLELNYISKALANDLNLDHPKDAVGKTNFDFVKEKDAMALTDLDHEVLRKQSTVVLEESAVLSNQFKKKEKFWLSKKRSVFNPYTRKYELVGSSFDFTIRKSIEINFRKALTKRFLGEEAKETFLANISHDIRTPITGMLGLIDEIKTASKNIDGVNENINMLETLTNEFLGLFNGILKSVEENESDLASINKSAFNLISIVNSCFTLFKPSIIHKDIKLIKDFPEDFPNYLFANSSIIKRILINLIGNAIKFTDSGIITVSGMYCKKEHQLELSVKDTGIGMTEDSHEDIFKRFSRIDNDNKKKYSGSGLGLYMVKKYVDGLKGNITVNSELGLGSEFKLSLPIELPKNTPNNITKLFSEDFQESDNTKDSVEVLVVEDNQLAARALQTSLQSLGLNVTLAETAKSALKIAKKENFAMIFLDLGLPDQSGEDVLIEFRNHSMTKEIPIFILSGHISREIHSSCINSGANNTYVKPISKDQLNKIINQYI